MFLRKTFHIIYRFFVSTFAPEKQKFIYVAIGDSTVEGLGASSPDRTYPGIIHDALKTSYKHTQFHNLGRLGASAHDVIAEQLDRAIKLAPDLITISVGANDIRHRRSIIDYEKNIQTILERLKDETLAEIVINTIPDMSAARAVPKAVRPVSRVMVQRFNTRIIRQAEKHSVILVDIFHLTGMYTRKYPEMLAEDGFHPSDFGYAIWATAVLYHIAHLIKKN